MLRGEHVYVKTNTSDFDERGTMREIAAGEHGVFMGNAEGPFVRVVLEGSGPAVVPFGALMTEDEKDLASIRAGMKR
jgi:hypothetical protein